jgi:hypothetical protein
MVRFNPFAPCARSPTWISNRDRVESETLTGIKYHDEVPFGVNLLDWLSRQASVWVMANPGHAFAQFAVWYLAYSRSRRKEYGGARRKTWSGSANRVVTTDFCAKIPVGRGQTADMYRKWIGSATYMVAGLKEWTNSWDLTRRNHQMGRYEHQSTGDHQNEGRSQKSWLKWPPSNSESDIHRTHTIAESWNEMDFLSEIHRWIFSAIVCVRFEDILWQEYKMASATQRETSDEPHLSQLRIRARSDCGQRRELPKPPSPRISNGAGIEMDFNAE